MREFVVELGMMSMRASVVICVVLIFRVIFNKLHIAKKYTEVLWIIPFLCLVLPWRMESDFSAWSLFENVKHVLVESEVSVIEPMLAETIAIGNKSIDSNVGKQQLGDWNKITEESSNNSYNSNNANIASSNESIEADGDSTQDGVSFNDYQIVASIWLVGGLLLLVYGVGSYSRLHRKILCSEAVEDNIYLADDISTPFVLGVIRPKIYVPSTMKQENMRYVIEHEKTHIMRRDYLWKVLACVAVCVHWFNPLVWIAFRLWEKDIEMACDEETISRIGMDNRWDYANVLLMISSGKKELSELFVAFGEGDTKGRIENILKDKNTVKWIAAIVVILIVILGVMFLTKPAQEQIVVTDVEEVVTNVDTTKESETTEGITNLDKALLLEGAEEVELIPAAKISTNTISGADGPIFDYLDTEWFERIVFHDYYGLFVYDMEPMGGIVGSIDLASIGCDKTQGDAMCEVEVTEDGKFVYLKPANVKEGYIYDIDENKLYRKTYNMGDIEGFEEFKNTENCLESNQTLRSARCVKLGNTYHYLESGSGLPIDLVWRVEEYDDESGLSEIHQSQGVFADYSSLNDVAEQYALLEQQMAEIHSYSMVIVEDLKNILDGKTELYEQKRLKLVNMIEEYHAMAIALEEEVQGLAEQVGDDTELAEEIKQLEKSVLSMRKQAEQRMQLIEGDSWLSNPITEAHELTMEELVELCDSGRAIFAEIMSAQVENCIYSNFVRDEMDDSLTWSYFCTLPYEGKEYRLQVSYWKPENASDYDHSANQLDAVYLTERSSQDSKLLYYAGDSAFTSNLDITTFIGKKYDIGDYLTLELPEGLELGEFVVEYNGLWDGCVFKGDMEEMMHGDWCPESWYAPGGVGVITADADVPRAKFTDGQLTAVSWGQNHLEITSDFEYVEGCDMQAVLCEMTFDTFLIPEAEDYKAKHNLTAEEMQYYSSFWYVFFAEEDSDYLYSVCLNKQYYDKEDVIELAKSVKFVK